VSYAWKPNPERKGIIAVTADGWQLIILGPPKDSRLGNYYWEVQEPAPSFHMSGGTSKGLAQAKIDVVKALAESRKNRKISDSPERRAKMAEWRAGVQKMFDDMGHGPRKP
jgi:hypothetical protein